MEKKPLPHSGMPEKEKPEPTRAKKGLPKVGIPENAIKIGETLYRYLELYPLPEILAMREGAFGDDRDGDKALMDWLIAVTDDEE